MDYEPISGSLVSSSVRKEDVRTRDYPFNSMNGAIETITYMEFGPVSHFIT
jgi:hypothetical protein